MGFSSFSENKPALEHLATVAQTVLQAQGRTAPLVADGCPMPLGVGHVKGLTARVAAAVAALDLAGEQWHKLRGQLFCFSGWNADVSLEAECDAKKDSQIPLFNMPLRRRVQEVYSFCVLNRF